MYKIIKVFIASSISISHTSRQVPTLKATNPAIKLSQGYFTKIKPCPCLDFGNSARRLKKRRLTFEN